MSLWRQLSRGLQALLRRSAVDREIDEELEHYLEEATAAHRDRGLSPQEARGAARAEVGNPLGVREEIRGYGWENAVEALVADLRYAVRRLRKDPGFTAVTVLTLALGIGATTAVFSAVRPILFEPLPYPAADRLTTVWEVGGDGARIAGTFGMYRELALRTRSFEGLAAFKPWQPALTGADRPERLESQRVSAGYFDILGVPPALGRSFLPSEDRPGAPNVIVLSDGLWRRRFGGDPGILGRSITLDGSPHVVVGVMPAAFENILAPSAELWAPLQYGLSQGRAWGHHLQMVGRLQPGVDPSQATVTLDDLGQAVLAEQQPTTYGSDVRFTVVPLHEEMTGGIEPALLAILGAVTLVLAITCVNVTHLFLARGVRRRGELALRVALGAPRHRLVRQLFTESLLLAALGGLAGMGLAVLGLRGIVASSPPELPRVDAIGVDGGLFVFGFAITTLVGLVVGSIPAARSTWGSATGAAQNGPHPGLELGSGRTTGGHRRTRSALVVAEVALALVLLVSSGLLFRSVERLLGVAPGFDPEGLLTMQIQTSGARYDDADATRRFFARALEAVREVPGVTSAALTSQLPLSGDRDLYGVHFDPSPPDDPGEVRGTFRYAVSPDYFETMGIPLRRGRLLNEGDRGDAPRVAVISESLAARRLPGLEPVGRRLRIGDGPLYTVVGVVGDVRQESLALDDSEAVYTTEAHWRFAEGTMSLVARTRGNAGALTSGVRQAIWSVDRDQPIVRVATMAELVDASAADRRFVLVLFGTFALAALALAAAGIYGVLSGSVAERTREIGIRSALGASRRGILAMVVRQGLALTGMGIGLGAVGAVVANHAITTLLFGVTPLDPATYLGVASLLAATATLAAGIPAWRAARVDPARTLRAE